MRPDTFTPPIMNTMQYSVDALAGSGKLWYTILASCGLILSR
jgi:hypothetical protein